MKTRFGLWLGVIGLGLAVGFVSTVRADDKAPATGTWTWKVTTQNGQTFEPTLKLKQDGEKLTGTISGRNGGADIEIKEGKVSGDEVSFKVTRERNGQSFTQTYKGTVKGDTIKGKIEMEINGEAQSRDWEAKRS